MATLDNLLTLQKANNILNQKSRSKGLREIRCDLVDEINKQAATLIEQKQAPASKPVITSPVGETQNLKSNRVKPADNFIKEARSSPKSQAKIETNWNWLILSASVLILAFAAFLFSSKIKNLIPDKTKADKQIAHIKANAFNGNLAPHRKLVIVSGIYPEPEMAEQARLEIAKFTGTKLRIVNFENGSFTVQIGPAYKNHEDALIVYDELAKYNLPNLLLKLK